MHGKSTGVLSTIDRKLIGILKYRSKWIRFKKNESIRLSS